MKAKAETMELGVPIAALSPAGGFVVAFRVALWAGLVLAMPVIFYQVLMAVPLQILYEVSVGIAWYWERQERKRVAALQRA